MGENSAISWTTHTFNPWWGCVKVSPGCARCYAETWAARYHGQTLWGPDAARKVPSEAYWREPLKWQKQAQGQQQRPRVFVASMGDVFETHRDTATHDRMNEAREKLARLVIDTPDLDWLFLTKRIESAAHYLDWMFQQGRPTNLWLGCTVENQEQWEKRMPHLLGTEAARHFISVEPMLGPITMTYTGPTCWQDTLDWVICGGESGPGCRPMKEEWASDLLSQSMAGGAAFWMKQLGGHPHKRHELTDFPEELRVRECPR